MEEVRRKPKKYLNVSVNFSLLHFFFNTLMKMSRFFFQSDDLTEESKPRTLQTVKEDSDFMVGEGPTLDRPLTSLEKLHIIVGYAIVRHDLR